MPRAAIATACDDGTPFCGQTGGRETVAAKRFALRATSVHNFRHYGPVTFTIWRCGHYGPHERGFALWARSLGHRWPVPRMEAAHRANDGRDHVLAERGPRRYSRAKSAGQGARSTERVQGQLPRDYRSTYTSEPGHGAKGAASYKSPTLRANRPLATVTHIPPHHTSHPHTRTWAILRGHSIGCRSSESPLLEKPESPPKGHCLRQVKSPLAIMSQDDWKAPLPSHGGQSPVNRRSMGIPPFRLQGRLPILPMRL